MRALAKTENIPPITGSDTIIARLGDALDRSKPPTKTWLLAQVEAALAEIPFKEGALQTHQPTTEKPSKDRSLTAQEAGDILGVPPRWFYRNANRLPFTIRLSRKVLRFSEAGLIKWREAKKTSLGKS